MVNSVNQCEACLFYLRPTFCISSLYRTELRLDIYQEGDMALQDVYKPSREVFLNVPASPVLTEWKVDLDVEIGIK